MDRPTLTLTNYLHLFDPAIFGMAISGSILLAAVAALLYLFVGYPFAHILARASARTQPLLLLLVMIPFDQLVIRTYALVMMLKADGASTTCCCGPD